MGTLCAMLLAQRGISATLWGIHPDQVAAVSRTRENRRHLPGYRLPDRVIVTDDVRRAFDRVNLIVSAVPCQHTRAVWSRIAPAVPRGVPIVSVTKGVELDSLLRPTEVLAAAAPGSPMACLSGPCIAPEVAAGKPTSVVAAASDNAVAHIVQQAFSNGRFRVYTSSDIVGVEIAGAAKNVIALAAGICDGIEAGDNAKASLLTRGLAEIARLGAAMGASPDTFRGLAGVGDLFTTCVSKVGRNRSAGEQIGRGIPVAQVVESKPAVIEGIPTTRAVLTLADRHHVEMPITGAVASVLFDGVHPEQAIDRLMSRQLKSE